MKTEEFALKEIERSSRELQSSPIDDPADRSNNVFMLANEALILQTKACEFFIREVTTRAWRHTDLNRRKTIQKGDIWASVGGSEVYDFLIDIIPRAVTNTGTTGNNTTVGMPVTNATNAFTSATANIMYNTQTTLPHTPEKMSVVPPQTADAAHMTHQPSVDPPVMAPDVAQPAFNFDNVSFVPMPHTPTALDETVQQPMQYHPPSQQWTLEGNTET